MSSTAFAILPEAATEWQARKVRAFTIIPKAELGSEEDEGRQWIKQHLGMFNNQRRPLSVVAGVATIHVNDFLGSDLTFFDKCLGASDYGDIGADVIKAANDPAVNSIVLDINSGGGSVLGCFEVARLIAEVDKTKPVEARIDRIGCSAAYALACGARKITAAPSAMVGSVGVIMTFIEYARMCQEAGISPHIITSEGADQKAAGNMYREPTAAERQDLQATADRYGTDFKGWVSSRRTMTTEAFRGQAVSGEDARRLNFVDALSGSQVVTKPAAPAPKAKATASTPTPKAVSPSAHSMQLTPETRAKGAAALAAVTNPATRGPAIAGLQESITEASKPRPDFSFLTGIERTITAAEYDRLGGLTEMRHKIYMMRRRQYCERVHLTPEQVNGSSQAVIPEMIPAAEVKTREATLKARKELPSLREKFAAANSKVVAQIGKRPEAMQDALSVRATVIKNLNHAEQLLGLTITK